MQWLGLIINKKTDFLNVSYMLRFRNTLIWWRQFTLTSSSTYLTRQRFEVFWKNQAKGTQPTSLNTLNRPKIMMALKFYGTKGHDTD